MPIASPRLLAVPFWIVGRAREIEQSASYQQCSRKGLPTFAPGFGFFARLFPAPSRLSGKGLLAV